jgi:tetratricopeptide (TPR) repeat protein
MRIIIFYFIFLLGCNKNIYNQVNEAQCKSMPISVLDSLYNEATFNIKVVKNDSLFRISLSSSEKALSIDSTLSWAYHMKAQYLAKLGMYQEAIETLKYSIINNYIGKHYIEYLLFGQIYEKIGDTINARKYYQVGLNEMNRRIDHTNGFDYYARLMQARFLLFLEGKESAITSFRKTMEDNPELPLDDILKEFTDFNKKKFFDEF